MHVSASNAPPSSPDFPPPVDPQHCTIVASPKSNDNKYTDGEARLLMNWQVQAKARFAKGHNSQATTYRWWDVYVSLVTITIFTVAATMAMGTERSKDGEIFRYFLCILSVFGTLGSCVLVIAQFWQRYEQHKRSCSNFSVFAVEAEASLARNTIGDKVFRAQRSLDMLFEKWRELRGPTYDVPDCADPIPQPPPKTAENVLRRWQLFAERETFRNEYAAKTYERKYSIWRIVWMIVVALSAAASLGTFLPNNTNWPVAFAYISLIFNIFAVMVVSIINVQRFTPLAIQHQNAAAKYRVLHDRAGKVLASRPKSGISPQELMAEALDILQPLITDAVATTPPVPEYMEEAIAAKFPPEPIHYATLPGLQVPKDDGPMKAIPQSLAENEEHSPAVPPTSP